MWTASQRAALSVIVLVLAMAGVVRYLSNPRYVSDPMPADAPRRAQLNDRIDPNTAGLDELALLPGVGAKKAAAIVAYRDEFKKDGRGDIPFSRIEDLLKIKGIGAGMLEDMGRYLIFPQGPTPGTGKSQ